MRLFLRLVGAVVLLVLIALMLAPGGTIDSRELIWDKAGASIRAMRTRRDREEHTSELQSRE